MDIEEKLALIEAEGFLRCAKALKEQVKIIEESF